MDPNTSASLLEAASTGNLETLDQLIEAQTSPLSENIVQGLLSAAAWKSHEPVVTFLLSRFSFYSIAEETVRAAVYSGSISLFSSLLAKDPSIINLLFDKRGTPLTVACQSRQSPAFLAFLLEAGADPNQDPDIALYPIAAVAALHEDTDAVALLLKHGAKMEHSGALAMAAARGNEVMIRYILENGSDHEKDCVLVGRPELALHVAAKRGHAGAVRILLEHGVDARVKSSDGKTALEMVEEVEGKEKRDLA